MSPEQVGNKDEMNRKGNTESSVTIKWADGSVWKEVVI